MEVYGLPLPTDKGLSNFELVKYAKELKIPNFRGVFMRDTLPKKVKLHECAIMNFNKSSQVGSHWVCYYKDPHHRIYFDSFGQVTPMDIQKYLKTNKEFEVGGWGNPT